MRVFIEGSRYQLDYVPDALKLYFTPLTDGVGVAEHVGYYNDYCGYVSIFIPKVFESLFKGHGSEFIENCAKDGFSASSRLLEESGVSVAFISRFVFIFQLSLVKYKRRCDETLILNQLHGGHISHNLKQGEVTEFEVVASLMDFYAKHRDLIRFKAFSQSNQAPKRIDWRRTVKEKYPLYDGDSVIYADYISSFEHGDASDELLVIYYSLLRFFRDMYGFKVDANSNVNIVKTGDFSKFCSQSKRTLKKLKGKYFDDRFKRIYKLLSTYFEIHSSSGRSLDKKEYLFVRSYNLVFEDMIDYMTSSNLDEDDLKNNDDGKIIDHLYRYESLIDDDEIFYIGDSKYYKESTKFGKQPIYKQFTYAKNVIQYNINLFNEGKRNCLYRDELTEGYNITPNFFIQAYIDDLNISSPESNFSQDNSLERKSNYHFSNRVFDRDSLRLCSFKINFLYVIKSYVTAKPSVVSKFREEVHKEIRDSFVHFYNSEYAFYKIRTDAVEQFVVDNFKLLNGKLYRSTTDISDGLITLGLASSGFEDENRRILDLLDGVDFDLFLLK